METTKYDMVNHPKHYTSSKSGVEVIEVTRYLTGSLSNAWKYCCRYNYKGTPKQDLNKAIFYLNDFKKNPAISAYTCTDEQCKKLLENMDKFISVEESEEIKGAMLLIRSLVLICLAGTLEEKKFRKIKDFDRTVKHLGIYADAIGDTNV